MGFIIDPFECAPSTLTIITYAFVHEKWWLLLTVKPLQPTISTDQPFPYIDCFIKVQKRLLIWYHLHIQYIDHIIWSQSDRSTKIYLCYAYYVFIYIIYVIYIFYAYIHIYIWCAYLNYLIVHVNKQCWNNVHIFVCYTHI